MLGYDGVKILSQRGAIHVGILDWCEDVLSSGAVAASRLWWVFVLAIIGSAYAADRSGALALAVLAAAFVVFLVWWAVMYRRVRRVRAVERSGLPSE